MQHPLTAACRQGANEPFQLDKFSGPLKPQLPNKSFSNPTTSMPHAFIDKDNNFAGFATSEHPSTHTYLDLACNGQFDVPFAGSELDDNDSIVCCEFDALQELYSTPSQGKHAWTLGQNVNGPFAEWLSHLGSQFYGKL